jgi:hypothetical protein
MPGVSNLFTINGNDYNDAYLNLNNSGASNNAAGANEVQEAAVVQNAYSVQYGREAGAQINYITKSGTNGFHGDLVWNWNGDRLNANDFFSNTDGLARPRPFPISGRPMWAARSARTRHSSTPIPRGCITRCPPRVSSPSPLPSFRPTS